MSFANPTESQPVNQSVVQFTNPIQCKIACFFIGELYKAAQRSPKHPKAAQSSPKHPKAAQSRAFSTAFLLVCLEVPKRAPRKLLAFLEVRSKTTAVLQHYLIRRQRQNVICKPYRKSTSQPISCSIYKPSTM